MTTTPTSSYAATVVTSTDGSTGDGLAEVNAKRASRGLRPYLQTRV